MTGPTCVRAALVASTASFATACAAANAVSAWTRLWRSWTSVAVVYAVLSSEKDPLGLCFCVPAMRACTRARRVTLGVLVVAGIWFGFLQGVGHAAGMATFHPCTLT